MVGHVVVQSQERQQRAQDALSRPGRQADNASTRTTPSRRRSPWAWCLAWRPARRPRRVPVGELAIGESEPDGQTPASAETRLVLPPIPDTGGLLDVLSLGARETRHAGPRISGWRAIIDRDRELCTKADHDRHLGRLTTQTSPTLREGLGIGADTAAEMLIICGDSPDRIHSEAAFTKLCGACPIPASSGMTTGRHRLYRGGHRQTNAALHRAVIVRMRYHSPTLNSVERRTAEGRPKREIIRCLKRFLAREIFQRVMADYRARQAEDLAA